MANILVLLTSSPHESGNCLSALRYCQAALDDGHQITLFFYASGAVIANAFTSPNSDELNIHDAFVKLATQYTDKISLIVCNTAANRRGVITEEEKHELGYNVIAPFSAGGLAEFTQYSQTVDKMVQF